MQVERFFHVRRSHAPVNGGATVRVVGEIGDDTVEVQVAYCSKKDAFCRKEGRDAAKAKEVVYKVPLEGLPTKLHRVAVEVLKRDKLSRSQRVQFELYSRDWSFAKKYWTPKSTDNTDAKPLGALLREKLEKMEA